MRYKTSVIRPYMGGLPKFYIGYKQVTSNGKNDRATLTMTEKINGTDQLTIFRADRKTGDTQTDPRKI